MFLVVTCVYKDKYDDLLNFCKTNNLPLLVFNKNDELKKDEEIVKTKTEMFTLIDIPNFGRCDYGFLYYIIKNYNDLPDKILFTKANFMYENINLNYALSNKYDYITVGKLLKYGVFDQNYDINKLLSIGIHRHNIETFFETRDTASEFGNTFRSYITRDFYKLVFADFKNLPRAPVLNMGFGPCFVVTRDLIKAHDISVYEKLIDTFYPGKEHWTKWENHTDEETEILVGKKYHDNLLRFWSTLFIQNFNKINVETDFINFVGYKKK
jgi:hypothetical protein